MIKSIKRMLGADNLSSYYTIEMTQDAFIQHTLLNMLPDELVKKLAEKYIEDHGDEILKRINEKVIDSKLISKVVANLRKELKEAQK